MGYSERKSAPTSIIRPSKQTKGLAEIATTSTASPVSEEFESSEDEKEKENSHNQKNKEETTIDKNCHEAGHMNKTPNEESSSCVQGAYSRRNRYFYLITIWGEQINRKKSAEAQGRDNERPIKRYNAYVKIGASTILPYELLEQMNMRSEGSK